MGFGNVEARLVLPRPASPNIVAITGLFSGLLIVESNDMFLSPLFFLLFES
jgi:hypothetical protein